MIVSLIRETELDTLVLPEKCIGEYWLQADVNGSRHRVLAVIGDGEKWTLCSSEDACIDEAGKNRTVLSCDMICKVRLLTSNERACVWAYAAKPGWNLFEKYVLQPSTTLQIGDSNSADIRFPLTRSKGICATVSFNAEKQWFGDAAGNAYVYLNGKRLTRHTDIHPGDVMTVEAVRIIFMRRFLCVTNPGGSVKINPFNLKPLRLAQENGSDEPSAVYGNKKRPFHRSPRFANDIPDSSISVAAPPTRRQGDDTPAALLAATSVTSGIQSSAMLLNSLMSGSILSAITGVAMMAGNLVIPKLTKKNNEEKINEYEKRRHEVYDRYLADIEEQINSLSDKQKKRMLKNMPSASEIIKKVEENSALLWNHRPEDSDYLMLRLGLGDIPLICDLKFPDDKLNMDDDELRDKMTKLQNQPRILKSVPILWNLKTHTRGGIVGKINDVTELTVQLLIQLVLQYSYDEVKLCLVYDPEKAPAFDAFKYIPHTYSADKKLHYIAQTPEDSETLAKVFQEIAKNTKDKTHYLFLFADGELARSGWFMRDICSSENERFHVICCCEHSHQLPGDSNIVVHQEQTGWMVIMKTENKDNSGDTVAKQVFYADQFSDMQEAGRVCKSIANLYIDESDTEIVLPDSMSFLDMFGVSRVESLEIPRRWSMANSTLSLAVPIGLGDDGRLCMLDIHQKQDETHGLIAGTTGSGKSEFIISYLLAMAVNFHPNDVSFVLIDYKGGGMAKALEGLPHTIGVITNLDGGTIRRTLAAINSEILRRQQVFEQARIQLGLLSMDIYEYQKQYHDGHIKEAMPHLLIVADEFAEFQTQQPEFMQQIETILRIGRSLGIHAILATQKPAGVIHEQVSANTSWRICLKVQNAGDSNEVIKHPDAALLTQAGRFYMRVGEDRVFRLAQSGYTGAPYVPDDQNGGGENCTVEVLSNTGAVLLQQKKKKKKAEIRQIESVIGALIDAAQQAGYNKKLLWAPPLEEDLTTDELKERYPVPDEKYSLQPSIGEIDDPATQSMHLLRPILDENRNTVVYGALGSGKSMLLDTLIEEITLNHSPKEVNILIMDFADDGYNMLIDIPHMSDVILLDEDKKLLYTIRFLKDELAKRRKLIGGSRAVGTLNERLEKNNLPKLLIIIHQFTVFNNKMGVDGLDKMEEFIPLFTDGPRYGIHFLITASDSNAVTFRQESFFRQKFVLQMNNDDEYGVLINAPRGMVVPQIPGRGLMRYGTSVLEFQTAHCMMDRIALTAVLKKKYPGMEAVQVPIMPDVLTGEYMQRFLQKDKPLVLPVALDNEKLKPYYMDLDSCSVQFISGKRQDRADFLKQMMYLAVRNGIRPEILDTGNEFGQEEGCDCCSARQMKEWCINFIKLRRQMKTMYTNKQPLNARDRLIVITDFYEMMRQTAMTAEERKAHPDADEIGDLMLALISRNEPQYKLHFLICATPDELGEMVKEKQYGNSGHDGEYGIFLGGGFYSQSFFKVREEPLHKAYDFSYPNGYYIGNGKAYYARLLHDEQEE